MYEQSIPALAYVFIGITSLVVTYSQITGQDVESTEEPFDQTEETLENSQMQEEPETDILTEGDINEQTSTTNPITNIGNSIMNTISPTAPMETQSNIPVAQAVPVQEDVQKIGGKNRKTKQKKTKASKKTKAKRKSKKKTK